MYNNLPSSGEKQLILKIHSNIIGTPQLSFNEKLILGLDYTLKFKMGFNKLSNKRVSELFQIHPNIISYCRKKLILDGYLIKQNSMYVLTELYLESQIGDIRNIFIPYQIYSCKNLCPGAKLLWGEYNSISKGQKQYFARRSYTSTRLNASEESITNWTKQLWDHGLLKQYSHRKGFSKSQKVVVTVDFNEDKSIVTTNSCFDIIGII